MRPLASYVDKADRPREVIARQGSHGSVLVLDRDAMQPGEELLVAHLGSEEPDANAALVCERYLRDEHRGRCRRVMPEDFVREPYEGLGRPSESKMRELLDTRLADRHGRCAFRLELLDTGPLRQLRWCRVALGGISREDAVAISVREVVGGVESYEPARALTAAALARYRSNRRVAVSVLRDELSRLDRSPIVLNRKLREAVLGITGTGELSMGEIALRCGRAKRCRNGALNGETSWLARRLGLLAESGAQNPTPWIHSDVLALIARSGIGLMPAEVEL